SLYFIFCSFVHLHLHSFPTRRSSDLPSLKLKIKFLSWKYCGISNWRTSKLFLLSLNNTDFFEYSVLYLCLAINRFQKLSSVPDIRIFKFKWLMTSPSTKRDFKISISA